MVHIFSSSFLLPEHPKKSLGLPKGQGVLQKRKPQTGLCLLPPPNLLSSSDGLQRPSADNLKLGWHKRMDGRVPYSGTLPLKLAGVEMSYLPPLWLCSHLPPRQAHLQPA